MKNNTLEKQDAKTAKGAMRIVLGEETVADLENRNPNPILKITADGEVRYANRAAKMLLEKPDGLTAPESFRKNLEIGLDMDDGEIVFETGNRIFKFEIVPTGQSVYLFGLEITETMRGAENLALLNHLFENVREGIMVTALDGTILQVNPAFTEITGYPADYATGRNARLLNSGRHGSEFYHRIFQTLSKTGSWRGEIWNRRKNSEIFLERLSVHTIRDYKKRPVRYLAVFRDVTDDTSESRSDMNRYHDALTGLPNRQLFFDRLERAIAQARRYGTTLAVMSLDLDKLKNINDVMGHHVGDLLLLEVAMRLKTCCRDEDSVCRLGGDEFMVILKDIKKDGRDAVRVAERILERLGAPFHIKDSVIHIGASIGITLFPLDGQDAETIAGCAETAMNRAKEKGGSRYEIFKKTMNTSVLRRIKLENSLGRALEKEEFTVHYQPKVDTRNGRITGTEALVRWQRSEKDLVFPQEFIPLAEETGLIFKLGEWVLKTACRQTKAWHDAGHGVSVAVNISARQFMDKNLVGIVEKTLLETGLSPTALDLEITENVVMRDVDVAVEIMGKLKDMGIRLSVDDFGTGYSSLAYLKRFPLNVLKIDKSFVRSLPHRQDDVAITSAILSMARDLILDVVAEGVETREQLEFMKQKGCEQIQGYLFSKPICADNLTKLLMDGKRYRV